MKIVKLGLVIAVAIMAIVAINTTSYAFHDGGVARCEACHTMHNSFQQGAMTGQKSTTAGAYGTGSPTSSAIYLLRGSDQSSTCLNCHEGPTLSSYHVSTDLATITSSTGQAPVNRGPGGDFGWLRIATTTSTASPVDRHGHNIVGADFGYVADAKNTTAPGGTYPAANLNCISCHNPHNNKRRIDENGTLATTGAPIIASGSYNNSPVATSTAAVGVYRFLGGLGYSPKSLGATTWAFTNEVPAAIAPSTYNRSEATSDTSVAYGSGMSSWCLNCHPQFDGSGYATGAPSHPHPTDRAIGAMSTTYNNYVSSGISGVAGTGLYGYSSLVPVERGTAIVTTLKTDATNTAYGAPAADASSKVMCLTCHRAHATGFESMTRFYLAGNTTDTAGNYTLASGQTNTFQVQAAYYDRPSSKFGLYQRPLCNKCHAKD